jgi:hypothetical protein
MPLTKAQDEALRMQVAHFDFEYPVHYVLPNDLDFLDLAFQKRITYIKPSLCKVTNSIRTIAVTASDYLAKQPNAKLCKELLAITVHLSMCCLVWDKTWCEEHLQRCRTHYIFEHLDLAYFHHKLKHSDVYGKSVTYETVVKHETEPVAFENTL